MIAHLLKPELTDLIPCREFNQLREMLCQFPPAELAEIFADLAPDDSVIFDFASTGILRHAAAWPKR